MSATKGFSLAAAPAEIAAEDAGQWIELRDRAERPMRFGDGEGKPVRIRVLGTYSKAYRRAMREVRERAQRTIGQPSQQQLERNEVESVAVCVVEWEGFFARDDGPVLAHTLDNVIAVLEAAPWIRRQVESGMVDHAGFSKGTSGS